MAVKLEGQKRSYHPKHSDHVECLVHSIKTTWGELSPIQQLAVESGLDTDETCQCILAPERARP